MVGTAGPRVSTARLVEESYEMSMHGQSSTALPKNDSTHGYIPEASILYQTVPSSSRQRFTFNMLVLDLPLILDLTLILDSYAHPA